jgi:carbamoyl-phosphate synthase small subunit
MKKALLLLEDGTFFYGRAFAADGEVFGELVFNTSTTGYEEVLTDPSYAGQIVIMTYPEIGIYGINDEDAESDSAKVTGLVVYRSVQRYFNQRANKSLGEYLKTNGVIGIEGIDTRSLTKKIRNRGTAMGAVSTENMDPDSLREKLRNVIEINKTDLVSKVSSEVVWNYKKEGKVRIAIVDCGCKKGILRELEKFDVAITVVPYDIGFEEIEKLNPDGVMISNGPGDPSILIRTVELIKHILKKRIPLAGICLGHQLLALAIGAKTYKMKFGHRGINHPVKDLRSKRVLITTHNHGFAVDPKSLNINADTLIGISKEDFGRVEITHLSLNDMTVEGIRLLDYPAFSVQFHPEASPGPHDSKSFFEDFLKLIISGR